jgi:hypothetical protein
MVNVKCIHRILSLFKLPAVNKVVISHIMDKINIVVII